MALDFAQIREMETLKNNCANKLRFLENVLAANETITFQIVDRCRDTCMQINQIDHALKRIATQGQSTNDLNIAAQIERVLNDQNDITQSARSALDTILSWVPPGPGSRRTDR